MDQGKYFSDDQLSNPEAMCKKYGNWTRTYWQHIFDLSPANDTLYLPQTVLYLRHT